VLAGVRIPGAAALEIHSALCPYGCRSGGPADNDLIIRQLYILSHNDRRKLADWIAYRVKPGNFGPRRSRKLLPDPWLAEEEQLEFEDYRGAHEALGLYRGHQAPLGSFTGAAEWWTLNYLSNISAQPSALNGGAWRRLEEAVRRLASWRGGPVHVMTGPVFLRDRPSLPAADEGHVLPSGYWKIVALPTPQSLPSVAFPMDAATAEDADFCSYRVVLPKVEEASDLTFFHGLDVDRRIRPQDGAPALLRGLGWEG